MLVVVTGKEDIVRDLPDSNDQTKSTNNEELSIISQIPAPQHTLR